MRLILQSLSQMAIPTAFIKVSGKRRNAGSGPACVMISVVHCHGAGNYCQHVNIPCHPRFYSVSSHALESRSLLLRSARNTVGCNALVKGPQLWVSPGHLSHLELLPNPAIGLIRAKSPRAGLRSQRRGEGRLVSRQNGGAPQPRDLFV